MSASRCLLPAKLKCNAGHLCTVSQKWKGKMLLNKHGAFCDPSSNCDSNDDKLTPPNHDTSKQSASDFQRMSLQTGHKSGACGLEETKSSAYMKCYYTKLPTSTSKFTSSPTLIDFSNHAELNKVVQPVLGFDLPGKNFGYKVTGRNPV